MNLGTGMRATWKEKVERYQKAPSFITGPKDIPKSKEQDFDKRSDEVDKISCFLLKKAGIDVDGDDEFARLARVGLKDRNPERILKYCEHLYVELVSYRPIWEMVGLTTTGQNMLFCENMGSVIGWQLDEILERLRTTYCSGCGLHSPRPKDWKWSYRWQRERKAPERMKGVLGNCRQL